MLPVVGHIQENAFPARPLQIPLKFVIYQPDLAVLKLHHPVVSGPDGTDYLGITVPQNTSLHSRMLWISKALLWHRHLVIVVFVKLPGGHKGVMRPVGSHAEELGHLMILLQIL